MNKGILKKVFVIIGVIIWLLNILIYFIESGNIFDALLFTAFETIVEFGEIESILSISGSIFILLGVIIKDESIPHATEFNKKSIVKYKILRCIGYLPFVIALVSGILGMVAGFGFFFSYHDGIDGFLGSIFFLSLLIWPLYIIGLAIIIQSSSKLKSIKNRNSCDKNQEFNNLDNGQDLSEDK